MSSSIMDVEGMRLKASAENAMAVFRTCGMVFQKELTLEEYSVFADDSLPFAQDDMFLDGLEALEKWRSGLTDPEADCRSLGEEWFRVFAGVGKPIAPPWGSYYTDKESLLFSDDTMKARKWYKRYGLEIQQKNNEPDDQIGLLLMFLSHLTYCELEALDSGDDSEVRLARSEQLGFMEECLLPWVGEWAELLDNSSRSDFYVGFERIALRTLYARRDLLRETLDTQK